MSLSSAVGTFATGWLATQLYKKHWRDRLGAGYRFSFIHSFYIFAFTTNNLLFAAVGLIIAGFVKYGYLAAQYTIGQGVVSMRVAQWPLQSCCSLLT